MKSEKQHKSSARVSYTRYNVENTLGKAQPTISVSAKMQIIVEREFGKIQKKSTL